MAQAVGAAFTSIHTSGHASPKHLEHFARQGAPRFLVPIRSHEWDNHDDRFPNVKRLRDGEAFAIT